MVLKSSRSYLIEKQTACMVFWVSPGPECPAETQLCALLASPCRLPPLGLITPLSPPTPKQKAFSPAVLEPLPFSLLH